MLLTLITFFIILSILIFVHEFGHFLVAKKAGIRVEEFGFGYPPRIWGKKIKGTIYSINWLPFGGFVRLFGEDFTDEYKLKSGGAQDAFFSKSKRARTAVLIAGVLSNFLLAIIVFSIIYSFSGIPTKTEQVKILDIFPGSPAEQAGLKSGDIIQEFNHQPLKDSNVLVALTDKNLGQMITLKIQGEERMIKVMPWEYEVVTGDNLWKISEKIYQNGYRWVEIARWNKIKNPGLILVGEKLTVDNDGQSKKLSGIFEVNLSPRLQNPENEGPLGVIISNTEMKKYPFWQMPFLGAWEGIKEAFSWTVLIIQSLGKMLTDLFIKGKVPQDMAGPVGIFQITGVVAKTGFLNVLQFLGILSVNFAVVNILPFPALDGGRLVFVAYEAIFRRKPKAAIEGWTNVAGMSVLILLIFIVTFNDIKRLAGADFLSNLFQKFWPF
ncbi:MAG: site-2 protease family protein [Candidatus Shapirobacteria bacterium]|nr:site-2 protease family protein [Candidatus Shapirobacteria bacterium]